MADRKLKSLLKLIEKSAEILYEDAPCSYIFTFPDGLLIKANRTFCKWLETERDDIIGQKRFQDFLNIGSKIYFETNYAPLLRMQGFINEITLELQAKSGKKIPVLISSFEVKNDKGEVEFIKTTLFDISDRKKYERELLIARMKAEQVARRMELLFTTGEILRLSSDSEESLKKIAEFAVEKYCDSFAVELFDEKKIMLKASAHHNPANATSLLRTKYQILIEDTERYSTLDKSVSAFIEKSGAQSLILIPMKKDDRLVGVLFLAMTEFGRKFQSDDLNFAQDLAQRIYASIETKELERELQKAKLELSAQTGLIALPVGDK